MGNSKKSQSQGQKSKFQVSGFRFQVVTPQRPMAAEGKKVKLNRLYRVRGLHSIESEAYTL